MSAGFGQWLAHQAGRTAPEAVGTAGTLGSAPSGAPQPAWGFSSCRGAKMRGEVCEPGLR